MSGISLKKILFIIIIILILTSMTSIINSFYINNNKYEELIDSNSKNINTQRNSNKEHKYQNSFYSEIGRFRSKSQYSFNYEEYMGGKPLFSPLEEINDIVANQEYVWFATNGGLVEYNKKMNNWNIFDTSNGILGDRVTSLALHNSILWIGTFGGLSRYSILKNEITSVNVNGSYEQNFINSIAVDNNNLWVGHCNTVSKYNFYNKTWEIYYLEIQYPSDYRDSRSWGRGSVNDIYMDNNDIWIVSSYGGIQKYSLSLNEWMNFSETEELTSMSFYSITGNNNNIWFGGYGIAKYSKNDNSWSFLNSSHGLQSDYINDIKIDGNFLWIISYDGICKYEITTGSMINYNESNGFTDYEINTVEVDNQYIWVGFDNGVYRYESLSDSWTQFRTYNKLSSYYINSILIDGNDVWFGTDYCISKFLKSSNEIISYYNIGYNNKTGFYYYSNSSDNTTWIDIYPTFSYFEIHSICGDENSIYFGVDNGLMQYNRSSNTWSLIEDDIYFTHTPRAVESDNNLLWLGYKDYIASYNKITKEIQKYYYTYSSYASVQQIAIDGNDVWFATFDGLWKYSKSDDKWTEFFNMEWITSVAIDNEYIWIGNDQGKIFKYSKSTQKWLNLTTGLEVEDDGYYNLVESIIVMDKEIWFGMENGLICYNKSTEQIKIYNETNNSIFFSINTMTLNGEILWIGSENGVKKFNIKTKILESFYENKLIINESNGDKPDAFPNDPAASLDSDGDKFPDKWDEGKNESNSTINLYIDAFPNDPAASVDTDKDGYPDEWNEGMNETNSTTNLRLDRFPNDPTKWDLEEIPINYYYLKIGPIIDENKNPVKGAKLTIKIREIQYTNFTDNKGIVTINLPEKPPDNEYLIKITKKGYKDLTFNVEIVNNDVYIQEPFPVMKKKDDKSELDNLTTYLVFVIFVLIILIMIGIITSLKRKRNKKI